MQTERALGRNPAELLSQPGHAAGTPGGGGGVGVLALMRVGNDVAPGVAWRARLLAAQLYRTQGALEEAIRYYQVRTYRCFRTPVLRVWKAGTAVAVGHG